ncbi:hypothetical protein KBC04_04290 [Candidatus Babeliales bacterium]|nr:hypothetical protein [Candidatus Babeliales bacterium]MBP9844285.1 hypothetical protein [Candidatus Babeliales bacterium]
MKKFWLFMLSTLLLQNSICYGSARSNSDTESDDDNDWVKVVYTNQNEKPSQPISPPIILSLSENAAQKIDRELLAQNISNSQKTIPLKKAPSILNFQLEQSGDNETTKLLSSQNNPRVVQAVQQKRVVKKRTLQLQPEAAPLPRTMGEQWTDTAYYVLTCLCFGEIDTKNE